MKRHICNFCSYETTDSSNWRKHNMSKKHIKKAQQLTNPKIGVSKIIHTVSTLYPSEGKPKSYTCDYCKFTTSHRPNFYKHRNRCSERKLNNELDKKNNELLTQENTHLKQVIEMLRESLINGGNITSTNGNSITEVLYSKMKDNPALAIDYDDFYSIIRPKSKLAKEILANFEHNTLHEFLSKFILKKVKKKNLYDQSIFASDTSRQTYYVKTRISDNLSEWKIDKCGIMVNELVIKPLIKIVESIIVDYDRSINTTDVTSPEEVKNLLKMKDENYRFILFIEDGKLNSKINKYLCPLLVMDFDKLKSLKDNPNKLPSLDSDNKTLKK